MEGTKKIKSMSSHQFSWNSEVEATWISLICWHHKTSTNHGLWTPGEEMAFTEWPKIQSQSQIFRYGRSIFCLPHRPKFSDFFALCLHWVSVVRDTNQNDDALSWLQSSLKCHSIYYTVCAPLKKKSNQGIPLKICVRILYL